MLISYNIICYPQKGIVLCCSTAFIFGEFSLDNKNNIFDYPVSLWSRNEDLCSNHNNSLQSSNLPFTAKLESLPVLWVAGVSYFPAD